MTMLDSDLHIKMLCTTKVSYVKYTILSVTADEDVYKLFAAHLGIDVNTKMKFLEVEDECDKYWLHTYKESVLRKIQLWLLKSGLIQAVGRARLLRCNCTVKLYASIPLSRTEINEQK